MRLSLCSEWGEGMGDVGREVWMADYFRSATRLSPFFLCD